MTLDEELALARTVCSGDFAARQKMIEEGNLGLIHALEKFDPDLTVAAAIADEHAIDPEGAVEHGEVVWSLL